MKTKAKRRQVYQGSVQWRAVEGAELDPGTCGRVEGIALRYNVVDTWNTMFLPGCLDKTRIGRVAAKKIGFFLDHDTTTRSHIGYVREMTDQDDGSVWAVCDIYDTEAGRAAKEYFDAVIQSKSHTGYSIGFYPLADQRVTPAGYTRPVTAFSEIRIGELSGTPMNAVPGSDVVGVRTMAGDDDGEGKRSRAVYDLTLSLLEGLSADERATIKALLSADDDADEEDMTDAETSVADKVDAPDPDTSDAVTDGVPYDERRRMVLETFKS